MSYIDQSDYKKLLANFTKGNEKQVLQENYIDLVPINSLRETKPIDMSANWAKYPEAMYEIEEAELSKKQQKIAAMADPTDKITGADFAAMKKDEGFVGEDEEMAPGVQRDKAYGVHRDNQILLQLVKDIAKKNNYSKEQMLSTATKFGASEEVISQIEQMFPSTPTDVREGFYGDGPHATGETIQVKEGNRDFNKLSVDERKQLEEYIKSVKTIKQEIGKLLEKASISESGNNTELTMAVPE